MRGDSCSVLFFRLIKSSLGSVRFTIRDFLGAKGERACVLSCLVFLCCMCAPLSDEIDGWTPRDLTDSREVELVRRDKSPSAVPHVVMVSMSIVAPK